MNNNAILQATGALKLVSLYLNHPTIISRTTLIDATTEAIALLENLPLAALDLAHVFRSVNAVISEDQTAYITRTRSAQYPYAAVVADQYGQICATATGKTKEGLAELIRLKLLPRPRGRGRALRERYP